MDKKDDRRRKLYSLSSQISTQFADLSISNVESNDGNAVDHIYEYAKEVMTLSLFYMEYQDSIREGGGWE